MDLSDAEADRSPRGGAAGSAVAPPPARGERRWSLDVTRILAIVGVVAIHVFAAMVDNEGIRGGRAWWLAVVVDIGFVWVVPVFVMLSGALVLAPRQHADGVGSFYRRRLLRLVPAMVFWSFFYFLIVRLVITDAGIAVGDVVRFLLEGRPYTHLYFLWLIVGLYAVAPVLAAFLRDGGRRRAVAFAAVVMLATVITGSSAAVLGAVGDSRPLTLLALTQWLPYTGFFLAGWALRDVILRGGSLALCVLGTVIALAVPIVQYGLSPQLWLLDALAPVSYFGPFVALSSIGIYVCANSVLSGWTPGSRSARVIRQLSDSAFGVFLVHFCIMILLRLTPFFAVADASLIRTLLEWVSVVALSFLAVLVMRRVPGLRRLV